MAGKKIELQDPPQEYTGFVRPIQQIIDEFWNTINNHPDVKLLTCSLGGRPNQGTEFPNTPSSQQHKMEFRFIYRESAAQVAMSDQPKPNAFEPGGKFYHLLPQREETKPTEPVDDTPGKSIANLLPEGRKAKVKRPERVETPAPVQQPQLEEATA